MNMDLEIITPGEILKHEFMEPFGLSANALAIQLGVPANRVTDIIACKRSITADTALRLAKYFNMSPEFWVNLQWQYDLKIAKREHGDEIQKQTRSGPMFKSLSQPTQSEGC